MAFDPSTKTQTDDQLYVSPTSDDSVQARYEKVQARESAMTDTERLAALRSLPSLFDDEADSTTSEE